MSKIKVIGIGGCGINVIRRLQERRLNAVEYIAIDADEDCLNNSQADRTVKIEKGTLYADEIGEKEGKKRRDSFVENVQNALVGAEFVFIIGSLGGRTGSAAMPIVAAGAKWRNACVIALAYMPFAFEGKVRKNQADGGLARLRASVDAYMAIENDTALRAVKGSAQLSDAFRVMDENFAELIRIVAALAPDKSSSGTEKLRGLLQRGARLYIGTASSQPAIACDCDQALQSVWMKFDPRRIQDALVFMEAGADVPQDVLDTLANQLHLKTSMKRRPWVEVRRSHFLDDAVRITLIVAQEDAAENGHG